MHFLCTIIKQRIWQKRIKLLVEAWTGVDLETTDIYGEYYIVF